MSLISSVCIHLLKTIKRIHINKVSFSHSFHGADSECSEWFTLAQTCCPHLSLFLIAHQNTPNAKIINAGHVTQTCHRGSVVTAPPPVSEQRAEASTHSSPGFSFIIAAISPPPPCRRALAPGPSPCGGADGLLAVTHLL